MFQNWDILFDTKLPTIKKLFYLYCNNIFEVDGNSVLKNIEINNVKRKKWSNHAVLLALNEAVQ